MKESVLAALFQGATLLTANRRLRRRWRSEYDHAQRAGGLGTWVTPAIFSWEDWLLRAHEESLSDRIVLSDFAERYLWEQIITDDDPDQVLLDRAATAQAAAKAWSILCQWRVPLDHPSFEDTEDTRVFVRWAREFQERCRRKSWLSRAELPDHVTPAAAELWLAGFDELSAQQQDLLARLDRPYRKVESEARAAAEVLRAHFPDAAAELRAAASWARRRIEEHGARTVGVVVQGLAGQRAQVDAIFREVLGGPLFNISLGLPLTEFPMIEAALRTLQFASSGLPLAELSAWLRSPFLFGGMSEFRRRAKFDAWLRAKKITRSLPPQLAKYAEAFRCGRLEQMLSAFPASPSGKRPPSGWVDHFLEVLHAAGWPGERTLNSAERQTERRWQTVLQQFAALDLIEGAVTRDRALSLIRRLLQEEVFQPETAELPVQVLEALQAAGSTFDALWVQGADDRAWPAAAQPTPFLPYRLQREMNLPHATADREWVFACTIFERLQQTAPLVVFSYPEREGDAELRPSRLLDPLPPLTDAPPRYPVWADTIRDAADLEPFEDSQGPPLPEGAPVPAGTFAIKAQAQCPFQAFAVTRLHTRQLEEPEEGLDLRDRGTLLHKALELFWRECRDHATLTSADPTPMLRRAIAAAVDELPAEEHTTLLDLERRRLEIVLSEWLQKEVLREPFRTVEFEVPCKIQLNGIEIQAKADRIDELRDGRRLIIDYKTSVRRPKDWEGDRPDEPQLPIYAISADPAPAQVAFAQIRRGDCRLLAGDAELDEWRAVIGNLAEELRTGHAAVTPKDPGKNCAFCGLQTLCRVAEVENA